MTASGALAQDRQDRSFATGLMNQAAWMLTLGLGLAFAGLFLLRGGLGDDPWGVVRLLLLSLAPIWIPTAAAIKWQEGRFGFALAISLGLIAGAAIPVGGLFFGAATSVFAAIATAVSCGYAQYRHFSLIRREWLPIAVVALVSALAFVLFTEPSHLFFREMMLLGTGMTDRYETAAIAQMIAKYHAPSIGADGLQLFHYHTLSMVLAAGMAKSANVDVLLSYLYWGGIGLKALLVWVFLAAGFFFWRQTFHRHAPVAFMLIYAWSSSFLLGATESESFVLGMAMLLSLVPLFMVLLSNNAVSAFEPWLVIISLAVGSIFCAAAKVSAGFLCVPIFVLALWRYRRRPVLVAAILVSLVLLAVATRLWFSPTDLSEPLPMGLFLLGYYQYLFNQLTVVSYLLPLIVIFLFSAEFTVHENDGKRLLLSAATYDARAPGHGLMPPVRMAITWFFDLNPIAQYLVMVIAACLTVLLLVPISGNNTYFSLIMFGLSLFFLPIAFLGSLKGEYSLGWARTAVTILLGAALLYRAAYFGLPGQGLQGVVSSLYKTAFPEEGAPHLKAQILGSIRRNGLPFSFLGDRIEAAPFSSMKRLLDVQAAQEKGRLAVFVPPNASEIWEGLLHSTQLNWWCFSGHLVVPAVMGQMQIRSIEPKQVERRCLPSGLSAYYGFGAEQDEHRSADLTDHELCDIAGRWSADRIYKLVSYRQPEKNSVITCAAGK
jgi:hypothetical protein